MTPRANSHSPTRWYVLSIGAAIALAPLGCMTAAIDDAADARLAAVRSNTESAIIHDRCPGDQPDGPNCGLILRRLSDEEFRDRFRERHCAEKTPEECQSKYERMIQARLEQRYHAADMQVIARTCDANPERCEEPVDYEKLLRDSHNARVRQAGAQAASRIEQERRRAHAEDHARTAAVVSDVAGTIAYAAHPGPKCRAYPSIFGGTTLLCEDGRR